MADTLRDWSLALALSLAVLGAAGCVYPTRYGHGYYGSGYSTGYHGGGYHHSSPRVHHAPPRTIVVAPPPRHNHPQPPRVSNPHPQRPQHRAELRPGHGDDGPRKPQGRTPRTPPEKRHGGQ
ncbi:MAG: hypothetical protein ACOZHQ_05835 [Thermodesulfobacteriota bacterium]